MRWAARTAILLAVRSLLLDLTRCYLEPHRTYHALPHIADMLQRGRDLQLSDVQVAAIWFHDAIYDPTRKDNEERSAAMAVERLTAVGWAEADVRLVARIVRDTTTHTPSAPEAEVVIDLDLASLALPRPAFERNGARIRAECAAFDDATFTAGRLAFMEAFLARERLFWTPWGAPLEPLARENLRLDVERLRAAR